MQLLYICDPPRNFRAKHNDATREWCAVLRVSELESPAQEPDLGRLHHEVVPPARVGARRNQHHDCLAFAGFVVCLLTPLGDLRVRGIDKVRVAPVNFQPVKLWFIAQRARIKVEVKLGIQRVVDRFRRGPLVGCR